MSALGISMFFFFFKQKTAYEIKECDWSSDVCSSDLPYSIGLLGLLTIHFDTSDSRRRSRNSRCKTSKPAVVNQKIPVITFLRNRHRLNRDQLRPKTRFTRRRNLPMRNATLRPIIGNRAMTKRRRKKNRRPLVRHSAIWLGSFWIARRLISSPLYVVMASLISTESQTAELFSTHHPIWIYSLPEDHCNPARGLTRAWRPPSSTNVPSHCWHIRFWCSVVTTAR